MVTGETVRTAVTAEGGTAMALVETDRGLATRLEGAGCS
jgi:hypothetical protein